MKKLIAIIVTAALAVGLALLAIAGPASAHDSTVEATCSSLSVQLSKYSTKNANDKSNTVKVVVDGRTRVSTVFGTSFSGVYTYASTVSHTWSVAVVAYDDSKYNVNQSGTTTLCPSSVTPAAVTFTDPTCAVSSGVYVVPTTAGVNYQVNGQTVSAGSHSAAAGSSVTVTAVPSSSSYTLSGNTSWTHTFSSIASSGTTSAVLIFARAASGCTMVVTPAAVIFTEPTCALSSGSYTVPSTVGVLYQVNGQTVNTGSHSVGAGGSITVTAVPSSSSYSLTGTTSWAHTFQSSASGCVVTPIAPQVHPITACNTDGSVVWTNTADVHYALTEGDGTSGVYIVTATAQGTNLFSNGTNTFSFPEGNLGTKTTCATIPHDPTATDITCFVDDFNDTATKVGGSISVTPVTGVKYSITGGGITVPIVITGNTNDAIVVTPLPAGSYSVAPSALPGYTLDTTAAIPLSIVDRSGLCVPTLAFTEGSVGAVDQTCSDGTLVSGYITAMLDPATLTYSLNGVQLGAKTNVAPGTYTVDMTPQPDFALAQRTATVTVNASSPDCGQLTTLAFTGSNLLLYGFLASAALLIMAGGMFIQRSRRKKLL